jgi:hypothetical protein
MNKRNHKSTLDTRYNSGAPTVRDSKKDADN